MHFASLGSGSAGNALLVERGETCVMLDCGFGLREAEVRLARLGKRPSQLAGILVTHEHGDHVGGVFRLAKKYRLPVWLTHGTWSACQIQDVGLDLRIIDSHRSFEIGSLQIQPFPVPHDAREPVQYVFSGGDQRLGVLTDLGEVTPHVRTMLSGCSGLILEFNHDAELLRSSSYPEFLKQRIAGRLGHLGNADALALLEKIDCSRLQHVVAAHLSERNNRPCLVEALLSDALRTTCKHIGVATPDLGFSWRSLV